MIKIKNITILCLLLLVNLPTSILATPSSDDPAISKFKAPVFTINMDLDVHQRYTQLNTFFKDKFVTASNKIEKDMIERLGSSMGFFLLKTVMAYFQYAKITSTMFDEVVEVSKATGVPGSIITLFNYYYELDSVACTSILARDTQKRVIMGSNLDYFFPEEIAVLVYQANYFSKTKLVYTAQTIYGAVGVLRGIKPNKFTIALN